MVAARVAAETSSATLTAVCAKALGGVHISLLVLGVVTNVDVDFVIDVVTNVVIDVFTNVFTNVVTKVSIVIRHQRQSVQCWRA